MKNEKYLIVLLGILILFIVGCYQQQSQTDSSRTCLDTCDKSTQNCIANCRSQYLDKNDLDGNMRCNDQCQSSWEVCKNQCWKS